MPKGQSIFAYVFKKSEQCSDLDGWVGYDISAVRISGGKINPHTYKMFLSNYFDFPVVFVKSNMVNIVIFVDSMQVIKWLYGRTHFSLPCCSDLGVGGWVIGNPKIVRIFKIRTQKYSF